jgi:CheY-like chemotaxis protein
MLDLARIEHGRVRIDMQAVDVYSLVRSSEMLLRPSATIRSVLYVEDNPVNAMVMKQLFAAEPAWTLSIATTGQAGVEFASSQRPSLIIVDMQLPDMSGLQVLSLLQQRNLLPPIGCIALSADAMPGQIAVALQAVFLSIGPNRSICGKR